MIGLRTDYFDNLVLKYPSTIDLSVYSKLGTDEVRPYYFKRSVIFSSKNDLVS